MTNLETVWEKTLESIATLLSKPSFETWFKPTKPISKDGNVLTIEVPNEVRRLAMKSALSSKVQNGEIIVLDELNLNEPKTKEMIAILNNVKAGRKALIVMNEKNENVMKSASNIPNVETTLVNTLNVYDILKYDSFIITKDAVSKVEEVYA